MENLRLIKKNQISLSKKSFGKKNNSNLKDKTKTKNNKVLSLSQLLSGLKQKRLQREKNVFNNVFQKGFKKFKKKGPKSIKPIKPIKPIIPPKTVIVLLKEELKKDAKSGIMELKKTVYNRRIIDYKHCGLLQRYIGLGGKILPRRQTRLTAKQQRYVAKTIKSARIMGLLPFVSKEKGFFR